MIAASNLNVSYTLLTICAAIYGRCVISREDDHFAKSLDSSEGSTNLDNDHSTFFSTGRPTSNYEQAG